MKYISSPNEKSEVTDCPHLGQQYHPLHPSFLNDPYPFFKRARSEEPVFLSEELGAWVVTRYDDVRFVLSHPELFSSRDALRPTVTFTQEVFGILSQGYRMVSNTINSDGERHKQFRRPLNIAFEQRRVRLMEPEIRRVAHRLIDAFYEDGKADIITQFANLLPLEIILSWFGIPQSDLAQCKQWSDDMEALFQSPLSPGQQVQCAQSYVKFQRYLGNLIKERRKAPGNDVISFMLESSLDEDDLVIGLGGVLLAGHETTASLIGNAIYLLLKHREACWQKLCEQTDLIPKAIEEVLRYDGSVAAFYRTSLQETRLGEAVIPEGALLLVLYGSANRDEAQFHHAEQFDLLRSANKHLAFGHGPHMCVGAPLARLESCVAVEVLSQRLPHLYLEPDQSLVHIPRLQFRGYEHLLVRWDRDNSRQILPTV